MTAYPGYGLEKGNINVFECEFLGEPNPHSQVAAWEFWALWKMVRRDVGLTDDEIGFLLERHRQAAMQRWL